MLVYEDITGTFTMGGPTSGPGLEGAGSERAWREVGDYQPLFRENARFWLDPSGTVLRYWFSDRLYRKGIPAPPVRDH